MVIGNGRQRNLARNLDALRTYRRVAVGEGSEKLSLRGLIGRSLAFARVCSG
jgi:hypothetical protein